MSVSYTHLTKRVGSYYTLKEHDSVRIKNRRTWLRYSIPQSMEGQNGETIEFLKQFCGMEMCIRDSMKGGQGT